MTPTLTQSRKVLSGIWKKLADGKSAILYRGDGGEETEVMEINEEGFEKALYKHDERGEFVIVEQPHGGGEQVKATLESSMVYQLHAADHVGYF